MIKHGIANSRMKDFHDLHTLSKTLEFYGKTLTEAVRATFKQRGTDLPVGALPLAFTPEFLGPPSPEPNRTIVYSHTLSRFFI